MRGFPKTVLSLNPEITDKLIVEQIRKLRFGPELENLKCPQCGSKMSTNTAKCTTENTFNGITAKTAR